MSICPWITAKPRLPPRFAAEILMPGNGDIVGSRVAIVFETPADIAKVTMGHHMAGFSSTWKRWAIRC